MTIEAAREPRPQVIVVEDEPQVQELLRDVLEPEGYDLISIAHPDALKNLESKRDIDLILIDLMLPSRNGIKLAGELRCEGLDHTPMIAMSASRIMLHMAQESGLFQRTLAKPFELSGLLDCVRFYAGRYVV